MLFLKVFYKIFRRKTKVWSQECNWCGLFFVRSMGFHLVMEILKYARKCLVGLTPKLFHTVLQIWLVLSIGRPAGSSAMLLVLVGCLLVIREGRGEACGCTTDTLPHPRIVLLGPTGVGKSTFGNRLVKSKHGY